MPALLWIGLGSALGGSLRYALDLLALEYLWSFPVSTIFINLSGSLLIGCLVGLRGADVASAAHSRKWHFWVVGFSGSYTTFSAFSWQVLSMIENGQAQTAGIYAAASVGLGILAVWAGLSWGVQRATKNG